VPSYSPGSAASPGTYATAQNRGLTAGSAAPASYGAQSDVPSGYGNASYGAMPGTAAGASVNPSYGGAGTSQGFYSPDYRGAAGSTNASNSYGRPANAAGMASGTTADPYGSYGQGGYAGPSQANPAFNQGGSAPAPYGAAPSAYGQAPAPTGSSGYNYADSRGTAGYAGGGAAQGGGTSGGSIYSESRPQAGVAPAPQEMPPAAVAAGSYRPGSTSRNTQFGTSDNLNVPGGESVQPASFAGGSQGGGSSLYAPGPVAAGTYPASEAVPTRTAAGTDSGHQNTYQNTYQR
jgi:hypothetical protein